MSGKESSKNILCRFCLETLDSQPKIEDIDEVITDINYIFNLEISDQDLWPKRICNTCKQKSRDCIEFFHKIKKGEEKLLKLFGEKFRDIKSLVKSDVVFFDVVEDVVGIKEEILEDGNLLEVDEDEQLREEENIGSPINPFTPMVLEEECKKEEVIVQKKTMKLTYKKKQSKDEESKRVVAKKLGRRKEILKKNNEVVKKYLGFKCDLCSEELKSYYALKFHFRYTHDQKGYMICCSKKFTHMSKLADHVKVHINPETFKCPKCSKVYLNSETYNIHTSGCLATPESCKIICEICSEAFPTPTLLSNHRRKKHLTEEQKRHQCPHCSKRFLMPSYLKTHIRVVHEKLKPFVCDMCGRGFPDRGKVEEHIKRTHFREQQPKHKCQYCGKQFIESYLKAHLTRCNVPSVRCTICWNTYKNSTSLKVHIKQFHEGQKRPTYFCEICSQTFSTKRKLVDHTAKHEGIPLHQCNFCDKKFFSLSTKTAHHRNVHPAENAASKIIPKY